MSAFIAADASKVSASQFLKAVLGEPRCDWDIYIEAAERRGDKRAADQLRADRDHVYAVFSKRGN